MAQRWAAFELSRVLMLVALAFMTLAETQDAIHATYSYQNIGGNYVFTFTGSGTITF